MAFSILTLSMQVIDDIQYQKRYFDIVVEHPVLMNTKRIQSLNQDLITLGIQTVIGNSADAADRFCQVYHDYYIGTILDSIDPMDVVLSDLSLDPFIIEDPVFSGDPAENPTFDIPSLTVENTEKFVWDRTTEPHPFYLGAYPSQAADALQEEVLHWERPQIQAFLKKIPRTSKSVGAISMT